MKNKTLSAVVAILALLIVSSVAIGCQREIDSEILSEAPEQRNDSSAEESIAWEPGIVYLKLSKGGDDKARENISQSLRTSSLRSATSGVRLEQVFDISGEYAPAMIREGLDRWYKVVFDDSIDVQEVIDDLRAEKAVEIVHGEIRLKQADAQFTPLRSSVFPDTNHGYSAFQTPDPLLKKQWHYFNEGLTDGFVRDADINLFNAWRTTTGDPKVIVAIIDSGVDVGHPDLKESMWTGEGGIHGKNFFNGTFNLDPGFHGTHVAGTVAARNNNNVGVAGVAGGDGTKDSGVRLMSCQVFSSDLPHPKAATNDQYAEAFIWAANHGALIANCSWGFEFRKKEDINSEYYKQKHADAGAIIQAGIDYFIKYAGNDPDGKPKPGTMMSGGVVIFASGNDSSVDVDIIPAYDPSVIAVAAFNPDFKLSSYSSCGKWVDILAPGGDTRVSINRGILSTVPRHFPQIKVGDDLGSSLIYNGLDSEQGLYAYFMGTSMATPHVTGIAALMVSHFGKSGNLTNKELQKRLLAAVKPRDHESQKLSYKGKMGVGYIDAALALSDPEKEAPAQVDKIDVKKVGYYDAEVSWEVPEDKDAHTKVAFSYRIYLSPNEIKDLTKPAAEVYNHEKKLGEELSYAFSGLETGKTYHVAIVACDRFGNTSKVQHGTFKTDLNHSPVIANLPTEPLVILNTSPYFVHSFKIKDEDKHTWSYKTSDLPEGVTVERVGDDLKMSVIVQGLRGEYSFTLELEDQFNGKSKYVIPFSVVDHSAPISNQKIKNLFLMENGQAQTIDLSSAFKLAAGLTDISFEAESNNKSVVTAEVRDHQLIVTPHEVGVATIIVYGNDGYRKSSTTFIVRVTKAEASEIQALYPMPAHSYLKILVKSDDETINVIVTSSTGEKLIEDKLKVNPMTHEATLELDKLVTGVYNLIVETSRSKDYRTFIKN